HTCSCALHFLHDFFIYAFDLILISFFFFNGTASSAIYTLSLHDALPIWVRVGVSISRNSCASRTVRAARLTFDRSRRAWAGPGRSEEHTSELQSRFDLVCRLLLEKKNVIISTIMPTLNFLHNRYCKTLIR